MKKFMKIVLAIVISGGILALGGCVFSVFLAGKAVESVDKTIKTTQKQTAEDDAALKAMLDKTKPVIVKDDFGGYKAEYTMTNDTKKDFDYIQVNYEVLDGKGVKISDDFTNITDIKSGQVFKVTLDIYEDGAATHKITSITTNPLKD